LVTWCDSRTRPDCPIVTSRRSGLSASTPIGEASLHCSELALWAIRGRNKGWGESRHQKNAVQQQPTAVSPGSGSIEFVIVGVASYADWSRQQALPATARLLGLPPMIDHARCRTTERTGERPWNNNRSRLTILRRVRALMLFRRAIFFTAFCAPCECHVRRMDESSADKCTCSLNSAIVGMTIGLSATGTSKAIVKPLLPGTARVGCPRNRDMMIQSIRIQNLPFVSCRTDRKCDLEAEAG
jgi:hypothetical protein